MREEVRELIEAHEGLEHVQDGRAAAVVDRFTSALKGRPDALLDSYLDSPEIADWYRFEFFKSLLKAERQHRKDWNSRHPKDQHLPVSYDSYWRREWFQAPRYSLATIVVLIEEDEYTFKEEIGTGGMGRVLLVRGHERDEALKVVNAAKLMSNLDESEQKRLLARFKRESKALSQISHRFADHLPTLYHVGCVDGLDYLTMTYVPGPTLTELAMTESWTVEQVISRMVPLARLLHDIHTTTELRKRGSVGFTAIFTQITSFGIKENNACI